MTIVGRWGQVSQPGCVDPMGDQESRTPLGRGRGHYNGSKKE